MVNCQSHTFKLGAMIAMVLIYFLVELIVGHALYSLTLVADSFHMLSDFIALIIGIAARKISKWPKSSKNTFGWQRAEVVGTLINTVILTTLTFTILIETIQRLFEPKTIERPQLLLGVGAGGLLINIIGLIILGGNHGHSHGGGDPLIINNDLTILKNSVDGEVDEHKVGQGHNHEIGHGHSHNHEVGHGHSHNHEVGHGHSHNHEVGHSHRSTADDSNGKQKNSNAHGHSHAAGLMSLKAIFLHVLADFFGSLAVVISALVIWLVPNFTANPNGDVWKSYIDPSISLLMVFLILISTIPLLKTSSLILLQSVPKYVDVAALEEQMEQIEGIQKVHDLHVWLLQSDVIIGTVHIRCTSEDYVKVSKAAKKLFHDFNIHCTTIQAEFNEHAADSNSDKSFSGDNDECIIFCDDKSTINSINECKAKQSCCPTRNSSSVALLNTNINSNTDSEPIQVRVHPVLQHQQSAPCLTHTITSSTTADV